MDGTRSNSDSRQLQLKKLFVSAPATAAGVLQIFADPRKAEQGCMRHDFPIWNASWTRISE